MKKRISVLLKFVKLGILFLPFFCFLYLSVTCALNAQEIEEIKGVEVETHSFNTEISDAELEVKEEARDLKSYDNYISKMTLLVTVSFFIFTFFIAVNVFTSNQNLKEAKDELEDIKKELVKLKEEEEAIVKRIEEKGDKIFQEYIAKFSVQIKIEEIHDLLKATHPDKKLIYSKLSQIIEKIDENNAWIVKKCADAFPNDQDFSRMTVRVLSNIAKELEL